MAIPQRKKVSRQSLDDKIIKLHQLVFEDNMQVRIPEYQRVRDPNSNHLNHYSTGYKEIDSQLLSAMTHVKMTMWQMVQAHRAAGVVSFIHPDDEAKVYETLRDYVLAWAEFSQVYPDDKVPDMRDFIAMNEYLEFLHPSYELNAFVYKRHVKPVTGRGIGSQMKSLFGNVDKGTSETGGSSTGFKETRYQNLISGFHDNVWRDQK